MDNKFINRDLEKLIIEAYAYFPVLIVTGPRQSGKTTLLRNMFSDIPYYTLENPDVRAFANEDSVRFLTQHKAMILDEVQNVPELLSYIQGLVDEDNERRYILSGSSQFSIMKKVSQSLAGRAGIFELLPFTFSEITEHTLGKSDDELIINGFYPAIYAKKNVAKFLYASYEQTYLEKDINALLKIKDKMLFEKFIRLCAGRIGSVFNTSELAKEIGVSSNTITEWLSVLQASYIVKLLPPYFENTTKRLTKTPKLYFYDTGLASYLLQINDVTQMSHDKMRGHLFENMVIMDTIKTAVHKGENCGFYFYRDSNGNEIDLLKQTRDGILAVEIKSAMTYHSEFESTLKKSQQLIKAPVVEKIIIYAGNLESEVNGIKLLNYRHFFSA